MPLTRSRLGRSKPVQELRLICAVTLNKMVVGMGFFTYQHKVFNAVVRSIVVFVVYVIPTGYLSLIVVFPDISVHISAAVLMLALKVSVRLPVVLQSVELLNGVYLLHGVPLSRYAY